MKRIKIIGLVAVIALVAAACGGGDDDDDRRQQPDGRGDRRAGPVRSPNTARAPTPTRRWSRRPWDRWTTAPDIILASIARANQDLDQATMDKAMECWSATKCDTGTGGDITMGYADGGGLNVWRQVTRMEAILQALTYPDIGKMMFRDAQWNAGPGGRCG